MFDQPYLDFQTIKNDDERQKCEIIKLISCERSYTNHQPCLKLMIKKKDEHKEIKTKTNSRNCIRVCNRGNAVTDLNQIAFGHAKTFSQQWTRSNPAEVSRTMG